MEKTLGLDKTKKYVVGVSGGSDSMMLLSLAVKEGLNVVVCHVNYKLRDHADVEEQLVKDYCSGNNIKVYTLYPVQKNHQNFQMWAREARYKFYKDVYKSEKCDYLLLGHQLDDHLENYLMSLKRGSHGWFYGIQREAFHHGMNIIRPLLDVRKAETRKYCQINNIPFGDDESNFTDHYTRNKIRHSMVEKADDSQIEKWLKEIEDFNQHQKNILNYLKENYPEDIVSIGDYKKENKELRYSLLRHQLEKKTHQMFSQSFIKELDQVILSDCKTTIVKVVSKIELIKEYGTFYFYIQPNSYCFVLDSPRYFKTKYFSIKKSGKTIEQLTVMPEDFPIKIRNGKPMDEIELRYGHKKLNRFFIDRKIPHYQRMVWPVVENCRGEVIFISGIGCQVLHYSTKPNLFVVK